MGECEVFSVRIRELRESFGMTQKKFSQYIGTKQQTLSAYERGLMKPPLDIVTEIAKKCNVSIDWLCGLTDKKNYKEEIKTFSDVIVILDRLLSITKLGAFLTDIDAPSYSGPASYCPSLGALAFDNDTMTALIQEWEKYRNLGNDEELNQNINKMWIEQVIKKYNTPIEGNLPFD